MKKILFYTNQFFGQIGGEEKAGITPEVKEGAIGPANLLIGKIEEAEIVATIICGDNYYAENMEKAKEIILKEVEKIKPDLFIAGPAFNAGRFGIACGDLCSAVEEKLKIPAITGLYIENPAVDMYKDKTYIVETGKSAAAIRKAIPAIARLATKLINDEKIGLPEEEGYIPKGIRVNVFKEKTGAERALDMLVTKLNDKPYISEVPIPTYQSIEPADPIKDLKQAKIAVVTTGGVVPMGNPHRLPAATAKFYKKYDISGIDALEEGVYESVHAGFDPVYANHNPNRIVPVDLLRGLEKGGEIGSLYEYFVSTTGNSTSVADATRMGEEIGQELLNEGVEGVILTST